MMPARARWCLAATLAVLFRGTVPVQAVVPPPATNVLVLGSWRNRVEFDEVKVVCGTRVVVEDAFDHEQAGWMRESGEWAVSSGTLCQTSLVSPALARRPFLCEGSGFTIHARVRKTAGGEGALIGFGMNEPGNVCWLNLGGWSNTRHQLEKTTHGHREAIGTAVPGGMESDRWYVVRIEAGDRSIRCYLDGRLLMDVDDSGFTMAAADDRRLDFGHALIPDLVADPSIVEINGTFYCYTTTDGAGEGLAASGVPVVWTSQDFLNWSFEGSCYPPDFDLKYWAPSATVPKDGRYYSFPTLDEKITAVVADSPTGPFRAPDGRPVTRATLRPYPIEQKHSIDAEVFIDDPTSAGPGQAYMVWALRRMVKLKPGLLSADGPMITIPTRRDGYSEGPQLTKRKGLYYYFYTIGGHEDYSYAYMISRVSPLGPWEAPENDLIAVSDPEERVLGPGHGCFFGPRSGGRWFFAYLEFGRGGTTRQVYVNEMHFNPDGTIQPIKLTKAGVGALRPVADPAPNLAPAACATASSTLPDLQVRTREARVESYAPGKALDGLNGTRWMADAGDTNPWFRVDLGMPRDIRRTEAYFTKPTAGHAYRLEWSLDGQTWQPYGGHDDVVLRSPHVDRKSVRARQLKLTIQQGEPGLWEFRVYGSGTEGM